LLIEKLLSDNEQLEKLINYKNLLQAG
jgi:hypothetical protein